MTLDERIRARLRQASLLAGAIAHQLGATMLPSIRTPAGLEEDRDWKRLTFQTKSVVAHLKCQKQALDVFRSKVTGDLDSMDGQAWGEWVVPLVQSTLTNAEGTSVEAMVSAPVELGLSHALLVAAITVDEQLEQATAVRFEIAHGDEATKLGLFWPQGAMASQFEVPAVLSAAAESTGLTLTTTASSVTLARG